MPGLLWPETCRPAARQRRPLALPAGTTTPTAQSALPTAKVADLLPPVENNSSPFRLRSFCRCSCPFGMLDRAAQPLLANLQPALLPSP